ncbi:MAG: YafY family transcriptional regulator [Cyanosarcina radialis HA8281-LM2]|jgi:predicted DNA-binding transcriptional regulator YafY|nr:YafY family transcriptional regulator [Cyanosarcina radialis HA8281-LM2]
MANLATRLITLIVLLQRQPKQTATQLAEVLDVSVRTVQRYMTMLEEIGIPIYAERGSTGGYALVRGYQMPPLIFTPEEAIAVYLGTSLLEEVWGRLYQDGARGALAKLDNLMPDRQRQEVIWARQTMVSIDMNCNDPNLSLPYLEQLRDAIHERHRVRLHYRSRNQEKTTPREVDPYKLVARWGQQYCIGYCHLRQALRTFRLDRIGDLECLTQTFTEPVEFDLQTYLATDPFYQATVRVRLRFEPEAVLVALNNLVYWQTCEKQPDGAIVVTLIAPDLEAAAGIVLNIGSPVIILEPQALHEEVRSRIRLLAAHFDSMNLDECGASQIKAISSDISTS